MRIAILCFFMLAAVTGNGFAVTYYVATGGDDANPGTVTQPWKTIQKSADTLSAGDTVYIRGGTYEERITINVSGSAAGGYATFQNYPGETPVIDGGNLAVPAAYNGLFMIVDRSYIVISGFEIRNYRTSSPDVLPVGIRITGTSHHIQIKSNRIHDIETNAPGNAHAIAVYGTSGIQSLNNVLIENNELYSLRLGSSEALVVNGNVENFSVLNNVIHEADNIAIDVIGFEGVSPDGSNDQARNGIVRGNTVYNISSIGNPAYNSYSAGGIYIDGGRDIVVEKNTVTGADIGIELASEHQGRSTSNVTVQNNVLKDNRITGIALGGYDTLRGSTENCTIINNTLYNNDTLQQGSGEILLQFDTRNNAIKNNIFYGNSQGLFIGNTYSENTGNVVDYNIYYSSAGVNGSEWEWKGINYGGFDAYRTATGNDAHSLFSDPLLRDLVGFDFHILNNSPAIDSGTPLNAPASDFDGDRRPQGAGFDIGADEYGSASRGLSWLPVLLD